MSVVFLFDYSADPDDLADAEDSEDPVDFFIHQGRSISLSLLQAAQQTCILEETSKNFDLIKNGTYIHTFWVFRRLNM